MSDIKTLTIHFICRGNKFRSRIAEAIVNSKKVGVRATSSGIEPDKTVIISPWASYALKNNGLVPTKLRPKLTSSKQLDQTDLVVVLSKDVYRDATYLSDYNPIVWNVVDIDKRVHADINDLNNPQLKDAANQVYLEIDTNINFLLDNLDKTRTSLKNP